MKYVPILLIATLALAGCKKEGETSTPSTDATAKNEASTASSTGASTSGLNSPEEKLAYSLGLNAGDKLKANIENLNIEKFFQGMKDAYSGNKLLKEEEVKETMMKFQQEQMKKMQEKRDTAGKQNKEEGDAFLAANKVKEGVTTTTSGLQYKVLQAGTGTKPKTTDQVKVHYKGTLVNGTVFDSSYDRGEPAVFPVGSVIPGWQEAIQLMPVGSKWAVYIPSDLAYGPGGAGGAIGPNSTLIFEVELLEIVKAEEGSKTETPAAETNKQGK